MARGGVGRAVHHCLGIRDRGHPPPSTAHGHVRYVKGVRGDPPNAQLDWADGTANPLATRGSQVLACQPMTSRYVRKAPSLDTRDTAGWCAWCERPQRPWLDRHQTPSWATASHKAQACTAWSCHTEEKDHDGPVERGPGSPARRLHASRRRQRAGGSVRQREHRWVGRTARSRANSGVVRRRPIGCVAVPGRVTSRSHLWLWRYRWFRVRIDLPIECPGFVST